MGESARLVYRSNTSRVISIAAWGLCGLGVIAVFTTGRPGSLFGLVPIALIALGIWELFWRPVVVVDDDAVTLVNEFHTVRIPWARIIDVDTKWAMAIVTPDRRYRAAAAPAPGAVSRPTMIGVQRTGRVVDGSIRKADAPGTDSGDAAAIVRLRLAEKAEAGTLPIDAADTVRTTATIHWAVLAAVVVLAAASVPALLHS